MSGSANQDNLVTTSLNYANYNAGRVLMKNFKKYNDQLMQVIPNILLVPRELEDEAIELIESKQKPNTANNDINAINAKWKPKIICNDFLTDAKNWFQIDERLMKKHNNWFMREGLRTFRDQSSTTLIQNRVNQNSPQDGEALTDNAEGNAALNPVVIQDERPSTHAVLYENEAGCESINGEYAKVA